MFARRQIYRCLADQSQPNRMVLLLYSDTNVTKRMIISSMMTKVPQKSQEKLYTNKWASIIILAHSILTVQASITTHESRHQLERTLIPIHEKARYLIEGKTGIIMDIRCISPNSMAQSQYNCFTAIKRHPSRYF